MKCFLGIRVSHLIFISPLPPKKSSWKRINTAKWSAAAAAPNYVIFLHFRELFPGKYNFHIWWLLIAVVTGFSLIFLYDGAENWIIVFIKEEVPKIWQFVPIDRISCMFLLKCSSAISGPNFEAFTSIVNALTVAIEYLIH